MFDMVSNVSFKACGNNLVLPEKVETRLVKRS